MDVELHPEAEQEFSEAAYRYESRVVGLGAQFLDEFGVLKELLANNPKSARRSEVPFVEPFSAASRFRWYTQSKKPEYGSSR